ncbi:hypothetical protein LWP59_05560 [Amycolatopsis acidiphila]|uniref:MHS family MFS transporter n=1 Tax=Amycolatopsis acidiphila TaxID=715473 RepID=A0A558AI16_9PSEU|nr:MHS family MFS transporter [Amycolatopsis acidiphila]TVT23908.1 MHS family MFS transporter [Amycolatopsis acidiphila]UIJ61115.1 hypothetical protein LWP59_05560 [Amycolatopsis acidiphila]
MGRLLWCEQDSSPCRSPATLVTGTATSPWSSPGGATIGVFAPILLVASRFVQGMAWAGSAAASCRR